MSGGEREGEQRDSLEVNNNGTGRAAPPGPIVAIRLVVRVGKRGTSRWQAEVTFNFLERVTMCHSLSSVALFSALCSSMLCIV